jgi:peptide methionine sulfoxide reductase MsrB
LNSLIFQTCFRCLMKGSRLFNSNQEYDAELPWI